LNLLASVIWFGLILSDVLVTNFWGNVLFDLFGFGEFNSNLNSGTQIIGGSIVRTVFWPLYIPYAFLWLIKIRFFNINDIINPATYLALFTLTVIMMRRVPANEWY
jgi:hypothetical protein